MPNNIQPDDIKAARATIDELCDSAQRDPNTIGITIHSQPPDRDLIDRFEEAGAERVLIRVGAGDHEGAKNELEELAGQVLV